MKLNITYTLPEIEMVAEQLLACTKGKTFLFFGDMGAGKTTLIKALVKKLGGEDVASSPTFSLVNEYVTKNGPVNHFDFYRIEDENEAHDIGLEEYLASDAYNFIEWPEKIPSFQEEDHQKVEISILDEGLRKLKFC